MTIHCEKSRLGITPPAKAELAPDSKAVRTLVRLRDSFRAESERALSQMAALNVALAHIDAAEKVVDTLGRKKHHFFYLLDGSGSMSDNYMQPTPLSSAVDALVAQTVRAKENSAVSLWSGDTVIWSTVRDVAANADKFRQGLLGSSEMAPAAGVAAGIATLLQQKNQHGHFVFFSDGDIYESPNREFEAILKNPLATIDVVLNGHDVDRSILKKAAMDLQEKFPARVKVYKASGASVTAALAAVKKDRGFVRKPKGPAVG